MTNQSDRQADARSSTSTALTYEGDSLAYFDSQSVAAGDYNGRLLAWINQALGTSYTEINGAKTALAIAGAAPTWDGLNLLGAVQVPPTGFVRAQDEFGVLLSDEFNQPIWIEA
jgi:hypothetical protein